MCVLCSEIAKENMTPMEIARASREAITDTDPHWTEVWKEIRKHSSLIEVFDALNELDDLEAVR